MKLLGKVGIFINTRKNVLERKSKMTELLKIQDFDQMYAIMEASFPYDEYRGYEGQKQLYKIIRKVFSIKKTTLILPLKAWLSSVTRLRYAPSNAPTP